MYLFCLRNKRPENAFLTLIVNYRKIAQKNKCHPKQQLIGYLMIFDVIYSLLVLIEKSAFFNSCKGLLHLFFINNQKFKQSPRKSQIC